MLDFAEDPRRPSHQLSPNDALEIVRRLTRGEFQNRIAALFDVNPGRISEIKNGYLFSDVTGIKPKKQLDLFE